MSDHGGSSSTGETIDETADSSRRLGGDLSGRALGADGASVDENGTIIDLRDEGDSRRVKAEVSRVASLRQVWAPGHKPDEGPGRPARVRLVSGLGNPVAKTITSRVLAPVLAVVTLTMVGAVALGMWSFVLGSREQSIETALNHEADVQAAMDNAWSEVVGLVASGVGDQISTQSSVTESLGAASATSPGPLPSGVDLGAALGRSIASHNSFIGSLSESVDSGADDPLALASQIGRMDESRRVAASQHRDYVASLVAAGDKRSSDAEFFRWVAVAWVVCGIAAAGLVGASSRRRVRRLIDEPLREVVNAVVGVANADLGARSEVDPFAPLGPLASEVDSSLDEIAGTISHLSGRAEWGEQSRMIAEAFDQADDEASAYRVVERALATLDDEHHPVELLIAERGSSRFRSVATDPTVPGPGCQVETVGSCVALRRGQVSVFASSESINACPMIRERPDGPCSAVCVPVTVAARPVGVLHMIGAEFKAPNAQTTERLVTLSTHLGNRLGSLRTLERTRKEASTDGLTGLPNRRMLQSEVDALIERGTPFVMVLADLDKFKRLNDNFGHEIGDKALQLFAGVLKDNVRGNDVVARIGGEEFVLVYPNMSVEISIEAINRLRQALARAVGNSRLPDFTCSFGISDSQSGVDGDSILRVADAGLLKAKELGGDQAVYADGGLVDEIFGDSAGRTVPGRYRDDDRSEQSAEDGGSSTRGQDADSSKQDPETPAAEPLGERPPESDQAGPWPF